MYNDYNESRFTPPRAKYNNLESECFMFGTPEGCESVESTPAPSPKHSPQKSPEKSPNNSNASASTQPENNGQAVSPELVNPFSALHNPAQSPLTTLYIGAPTTMSRVPLPVLNKHVVKFKL